MGEGGGCIFVFVTEPNVIHSNICIQKNCNKTQISVHVLVTLEAGIVNEVVIGYHWLPFLNQVFTEYDA